MSEPFIPDLGGWTIGELLRLSTDISYREQCYRKSDSDLILEDSVDGVAKSLVQSHGRRIANVVGKRLSQLPLTTDHYRELARMVEIGIITYTGAGTLIDEVVNVGGLDLGFQRLAEKMNLFILNDDEELTRAVNTVIQANSQAVLDYKSGKTAAIGSLVGKVLKIEKRLNPSSIRIKLEEKLR